MTNLILKKTNLSLTNPNPSPLSLSLSLSLSNLWLPLSLSLSPTPTAAKDSLFHGRNPFFPLPSFTLFSNQCHGDIWLRIFELHITTTAIVPCQQLLIWCQTSLGLCFWVWISISEFGPLFLGLGLCLCLGLCVKCQENV